MQISPSSNNSGTSNFGSNGVSRKRKVPASELDDKPHPKMFVTEEKMIHEMQTLSLELSNWNNNRSASIDPLSTLHIHEKNSIDLPSPRKKEGIEYDDDDDDKPSADGNERTRFELHKLVKDSLKQDNDLLSKLCDLERKKLTMQLVPYMPVHPSQLDNTNSPIKNKSNKKKSHVENISPEIVTEKQDDESEHVFKRPMVPSLYTVEEPCDDSVKSGRTMKRRYSQSTRYNNNLPVVEIKDHGEFSSPDRHPPSPYFIDEPSTPALTRSTTYPIPLNGSSVKITEYFDQPLVNVDVSNTYDDDDMQSIGSSDTGDVMDED